MVFEWVNNNFQPQVQVRVIVAMHTFKCIQKHKWIMRAHQQRRRLRCRRHTGSLHGKSNRAAWGTVWHVLDRSDCTFTFEPKDEKTYLVTLFNGTLTFSLYALCCLHEHNHHNNFSLGHFQAAKNAFVCACSKNPKSNSRHSNNHWYLHLSECPSSQRRRQQLVARANSTLQYSLSRACSRLVLKQLTRESWE